jgi:hypothetical protein
MLTQFFVANGEQLFCHIDIVENNLVNVHVTNFSMCWTGFKPVSELKPPSRGKQSDDKYVEDLRHLFSQQDHGYIELEFNNSIIIMKEVVASSVKSTVLRCELNEVSNNLNGLFVFLKNMCESVHEKRRTLYEMRSQRDAALDLVSGLRSDVEDSTSTKGTLLNRLVPKICLLVNSKKKDVVKGATSNEDFDDDETMSGHDLNYHAPNNSKTPSFLIPSTQEITGGNIESFLNNNVSVFDSQEEIFEPQSPKNVMKKDCVDQITSEQNMSSNSSKRKTVLEKLLASSSDEESSTSQIDADKKNRIVHNRKKQKGKN